MCSRPAFTYSARRTAFSEYALPDELSLKAEVRQVEFKLLQLKVILRARSEKPWLHDLLEHCGSRANGIKTNRNLRSLSNCPNCYPFAVCWLWSSLWVILKPPFHIDVLKTRILDRRASNRLCICAFVLKSMAVLIRWSGKRFAMAFSTVSLCIDSRSSMLFR
jgi:hypothetical protein